MKKYQELAKAYAQDAGEIKELQKRLGKTQDYDEFSRLNDQLGQAVADLRDEIANEYAGVPFPRSREQGIVRTWKELGLFRD